jgi:hypothetical protein
MIYGATMRVWDLSRNENVSKQPGEDDDAAGWQNNGFVKHRRNN